MIELRNLTEPEREKLVQLLAPYLAEKQAAERMIAVVGGAFLAGMGFPGNLHIDLDTGTVSARPLPNGVVPSSVFDH